MKSFKSSVYISGIYVVINLMLCFNCAGQYQPIAVIELYSSQGCSSCPPADRLLSKTIADARKDGKNVFALEFHVDYWNRLGWSDPFSLKKFTERQDKYASKLGLSSVYTPEMIVNGTIEFVGSDESALKSALSKALQTKAPASFKTLSASIDTAGVHVKYEIEGDYYGSKINIALVSLSESTPVRGGENGGHTLLNEHVVRQFISEPARASGKAEFSSSPLPAKDNRIIIAYIQHNDDYKIVGAAMADLH